MSVGILFVKSAINGSVEIEFYIYFVNPFIHFIFIQMVLNTKYDLSINYLLLFFPLLFCSSSSTICLPLWQNIQQIDYGYVGEALVHDPHECYPNPVKAWELYRPQLLTCTLPFDAPVRIIKHFLPLYLCVSLSRHLVLDG